MNWDALGAIGEPVGAVAVVLTLLYVARQIHQANVQTQARARYSFIVMMSEPGGKALWDEVGQKGVHDEFRHAVNEVLASGETSYEMRWRPVRAVSATAARGPVVLKRVPGRE